MNISLSDKPPGFVLTRVDVDLWEHALSNPKVRGFIEEAVEWDAGRYTIEDVFQKLWDGADLWVVIAADTKQYLAALITEIVDYPQCKALAIRICGGRGFKLWLPLLEQIEAHGRALGCDRMEFWGRKGWARVLPEYRIKHVFLEKMLHEHRRVGEKVNDITDGDAGAS